MKYFINWVFKGVWKNYVLLKYMFTIPHSLYISVISFSSHLSIILLKEDSRQV